MTKKINNHTPDSDELLNRVKTGNSDGLDDFEKEAFEGFASLENNELAQKLSNDLNKKIEEVYFKKEAEKPKFRYYAMAAGLVLVIGLSVMFVVNFTKSEDSLAYKSEKTEEVANKEEGDLKQEISNESGVAGGVNSAEAVEAEPKKESSTQSPPPAPAAEKTVTDELRVADKRSQKDEDQSSSEPRPRMIVKGPETKSAQPVVTEEQKQQPAESIAIGGKDAAAKGNGGGSMDAENKKAERKERDEKPADDIYKDAKLAATETKSGKKQDEFKAKEKKSLEKSQSTDNNNSVAQSAPAGAAMEGQFAKNDKTKPERAKESDDANLAEAEVHNEANAPKSVTTISAASGKAVSLRRSSFFKTAKFANHIDYIKSEIDKNEKLKTQIIAFDRSFRIDLTVNESGKVTNAKADVQENKCKDCKSEIEKIILNMPLWEPAQDSNGAPAKQTFYFNYKY